MGATLPTGRVGAPAIWTGEHVYLFGGTDTPENILSEILKYDPAADELEVLDTNLPTGRYGSGAAWTGDYAYIFGGWNSETYDEILRFDPLTGEVQTMNAALPTALHWVDATAFGDYIYLFGGHSGSPSVDSVFRYHPTSDSIKTMDAKLPSGRDKVAAVPHGNYIYLIGGESRPCDCPTTDDILRYDPHNDEVRTMAQRLPEKMSTEAALVGDEIFIFGGRDESGAVREVFSYDPATDTLRSVNVTLPKPAQKLDSASTNGSILLFGGEAQWDGERYDQILKFTPPADDDDNDDQDDHIRIERATPKVEQGVTVPGTKTPGLEAQTVTIPGTEIGQTCAGGFACVGPVTTPSRNATTPGMHERHLTPETELRLGVNSVNVSIMPHLGETQEYGPYNQTIVIPGVGELPLGVCPSGCSGPKMPEATFSDEIVVRIGIGSNEHVVRVPTLPEQ